MEALDQEDYDPVVHLQMLFSSPSNLGKLSEIKSAVSLHQRSLTQQIITASQQNQAHQQEEYYNRIINGKETLDELYARINGLRNQAHVTESKITTMTSHIISLDKTKSNLIYSITVLKRLQMLTTAYDQLSVLVRNRHYREMAQTLPAVQELMSHFKPFRSISQIAALNRQIGEIQVKITDQIFSDFDTVLSGKGNSDMANNLSDASLVLELLGENNKSKLIHWYCTTQLKEYRTIFKSSDEAGSLENISRRFAYFKRLLKQHVESNAKYFDPSWHMAEELTNSFCNTTRDDITTLLSQSGKNVNVQLLLQALQETLEFEQYLEKRFGSVSDSRNSVENRRAAQHKENEEDDSNPFTSGKAISLAFQPHLSIWIDYQDKQLSSKFAQYKAPPPPKNSDTESEPEPTVLPSSADLFIFYRQILAQTAKLSTGDPLYNLSKLFGKWLDIYCSQILRTAIPNRLHDEEEFKTLALAISTADYCFNTISQLEEKLQSTIDPELKDKVNFENEKGRFLDIVNLGIKKLVGRVESALEISWREMANTNWGKLSSVGDQSSYVSELNRSLLTETKIVLKYTTKKTYIRLICDKIVESVANSFLLSVVRCRPISEVASEQMLLDLYVVKRTLLKLPNLSTGADPEEPPTANYTRHVTGSVGRVETILKVILTQTNPPEGLVQNYFYLIGDKSAENFKKIMELKGMSRSDQSRFVEMFYSHMKAHDNLVDESPLLQVLRLSGGGSLSTLSGNNSVTVSNGYSILNGGSNNAFGNIGGSSRGGNLRDSQSSGLLSGTGSGFLTPANGGNDVMSAFAASLKTSPSSIHIPKFEPQKSLSLAKDQIEKSLEKIAQETPVSKINENFKTFGRLFRRDTSNNNGNN